MQNYNQLNFDRLIFDLAKKNDFDTIVQCLSTRPRPTLNAITLRKLGSVKLHQLADEAKRHNKDLIWQLVKTHVKQELYTIDPYTPALKEHNKKRQVI